LESIRWPRPHWTLEAIGDGDGLRFAPRYDLRRLYLLVTCRGFVLRLCNLFNLLITFSMSIWAPFPVDIFFSISLYKCRLGAFVEQSGAKVDKRIVGLKLPRARRRPITDRITPPPTTSPHVCKTAGSPSQRWLCRGCRLKVCR